MTAVERDELAAWLRVNGFELETPSWAQPPSETLSYTRGPVRVTVEEAAVCIFVFDGLLYLTAGKVRFAQRRLALAWQARYDSAPPTVTGRAVTAALEITIAAMLPNS